MVGLTVEQMMLQQLEQGPLIGCTYNQYIYVDVWNNITGSFVEIHELLDVQNDMYQLKRFLFVLLWIQ